MATIGSQIRAYFHAQIVAATGLASAKVLKSPRFTVDAKDLPLIAVYSHSDKPEDADQISSRTHGRIYTVAVEMDVQGRIEEDATDALAVQIRKAILSDGTLGGICTYTTWSSQEWGSKETAIAESASVMLFSCHYMWRQEW